MSTTWGRSRAARRRGVSPNQELVERLAAMERERDAARDDAAHCRREWSKTVDRAHRAEREATRLATELAGAEDSEMVLAAQARKAGLNALLLREAVQVVAAQMDTSSAYWAVRATETAEPVKRERRAWRARVFAQLRDDIDEALKAGGA